MDGSRGMRKVSDGNGEGVHIAQSLHRTQMSMEAFNIGSIKRASLPMHSNASIVC